MIQYGDRVDALRDRVRGNNFLLSPVHPDEMGQKRKKASDSPVMIFPNNGDGQVMNAESDADGLAKHKEKSMCS